MQIRNDILELKIDAILRALSTRHPEIRVSRQVIRVRLRNGMRMEEIYESARQGLLPSSFPRDILIRLVHSLRISGPM